MRLAIASQELVLLFVGLQGRNIGVESSDHHRHGMSHQQCHHWHKPMGLKNSHRQRQRQDPQTCKGGADE